MKKIDRKLREINTHRYWSCFCKKIAWIGFIIILCNYGLGYIFYKITTGISETSFQIIFIIIPFIFFVVASVAAIIGLVNNNKAEKKLLKLKSDFKEIKIKDEKYLCIAYLNEPIDIFHSVFFKGPEVEDKIIIISILSNGAAKGILMKKEDFTNIFEIE